RTVRRAGPMIHRSSRTTHSGTRNAFGSCSPFPAPLLVDSPATRSAGSKTQGGGRGRTLQSRHLSTAAGQGGQGVPSQWRIRHKLMLGLALAVGILVLLLLGSLEGLASYRTTMNLVDSKLRELQKAQEVQLAITALAAPFDSGVTPQQELGELRRRVQSARRAFTAYQEARESTLERGRDPDGGFREQIFIDGVEECFGKLELELNAWDGPHMLPQQGTRSLRADDAVNLAINTLLEASRVLQKEIYQGQYEHIAGDKSHFKTTMWVVVTTGIVGVLLMAGLSRFFYTW